MGSYLLRRLLIAVPSLLGISVVLFTVLALAPGDPFEELATNPNVPAEVRLMLRAKYRPWTRSSYEAKLRGAFSVPARKGNMIDDFAATPIRHGRMSATPFTFYRGAAAVMASDLAALHAVDPELDRPVVQEERVSGGDHQGSQRHEPTQALPRWRRFVHSSLLLPARQRHGVM